MGSSHIVLSFAHALKSGASLLLHASVASVASATMSRTQQQAFGGAHGGVPWLVLVWGISGGGVRSYWQSAGSKLGAFKLREPTFM